MDKNKIKKIIILSTLIIVAVIVTIIVIVNNSNKYKKTIFLGSSTRIKVNNNSITMSNDDIEIKKQNVKIINGNKTIDGYILSEDDEEDISEVLNNCHAYTEEGKRINFDTSLIAYTKDLKVNYILVNNEYFDEIDILDDYFEENDIDTSEIYLDYLKISYFDFDKDSKYEYIYSIGFTYGEEEYNSMVIMEKDSEYYLIADESSTYGDDNTISFDFLGILDFNEKNNYYFIVKRLIGNYGPDQYDLYNFDGNKFTKANHNN